LETDDSRSLPRSYSFGACQPPSSCTGAGSTGWATNCTRADEFNCRDVVRSFGSGNAGDGSELDFVSCAGIGSSFSSAADLFAFFSNVRGCEAFELESAAGTTVLDDATLHDEHPEDGAPYITDPHPPHPHEL